MYICVFGMCILIDPTKQKQFLKNNQNKEVGKLKMVIEIK